MSYELYWISGSPNAWRVQLAMELKGLRYVSHRLDPGKKEHKTAEFLTLNPRGKVPVLIDGEMVLSESLAILAYLEHRHPDRRRLFGDTPEQAGFIWQRVFEVMNYARDDINNGVVRPLIRSQAEQQGDPIKAAALRTHAALGWVEDTLSKAPYLAGQTLSAADVTYMPIVQGLLRAGKRDDAKKLELGLDTIPMDYPALARWLGRIEALPEYDKAYPPHWRET